MENNWLNSSVVKSPKHLSRRQFVANAGAAALALTASRSNLAKAAPENEKIRIGLIGCGARGTWIMDLFKQHGSYEIVAGADYFPDKVDAFGDKFGLPPNRRYTTLSGYKKLLDSNIDAVAIESPPYFHPEQAAAAIDAGKHVYLAKPVAIDVPGCQTIAQSGKKAAKNKAARKAWTIAYSQSVRFTRHRQRDIGFELGYCRGGKRLERGGYYQRA